MPQSNGLDTHALEQQRYPIWFGQKGFVGNTDEKKKTSDTLAALALNLKTYAPSLFHQPNNRPMISFDMGSGRGNLSADVSNLLNQLSPSGNQPYAADKLDAHVELTRNALVASQRLYEGGLPSVRQMDLAQEGLSVGRDMGLPGAINFLTASHVGYYPFSEGGKSRLSQFIDNTVRDLDANGVAVLIHVSPDSDLEPIKDKYGKLAEYRTTKALREIMGEKGIKVYSLAFPAKVTFPRLTSSEWDAFTESAMKPTGSDPYASLSPRDYTMRALTEFTVHRRLEDLQREGKLQSYLSDLRAILERTNYEPVIINEVMVAVSPQADKNPAFAHQIRKAVAETKKTLRDTTPLITAIEQPATLVSAGV